jgi:hypothetical protein
MGYGVARAAAPATRENRPHLHWANRELGFFVTRLTIKPIVRCGPSLKQCHDASPDSHHSRVRYAPT